MSKRIIERIWSLRQMLDYNLISGRTASRLKKYFRGNTGHNFDLGHKGDLGYGLVHYALIRNLKPQRVLCIGSGYGFIPAICAQACKENSLGQVDFVDAGYGRKDKNNWGGTGFWRRINPEKYFARMGLSRWVSTYVMTSQDFIDLGPARKWGYIYVDANHSYKGVKSDYTNYWPRLEKGGYMVFHDILIKSGTSNLNYGVGRFWNEIDLKSKLVIPFTIPWGTPSGLGILQKT